MSNCTFQNAWLACEEFKDWLARDESRHSAVCKLCSKSFAINTMGRSAVTSHMKGKKHQEKLRLSMSSLKATLIHTKDQPSSSLQNALDSANVPVSNPATSNDAYTTSESTLSNPATSNDTSTTSESTLSNPATSNDTSTTSESTLVAVSLSDSTTTNEASSSEQPSVTQLVSKKDVLRAERIWAQHCAENNYPLSALEDFIPLFHFQQMFPDSEIAKHMNIERTKNMYYNFKKREEEELKRYKRKLAKEEIEVLTTKKKRLEKNVSSLLADANKTAETAEELQSFLHLSKSNALRLKAKEKTQILEELTSEIEEKVKLLKNL